MTKADDAYEAARAAFLQGLAHQQAGRWAQAEAQYRQALVHMPGRASVLTNLGAALLALGRAGEALPLLQQALQAEPGNDEALLHQARALQNQGRWAEALASLETLVQRQPGLPGAWLDMAALATRLNRLPQALTALERALQLDDRVGAAWAQYGALLKDLGRPAEAARALQRALAAGADAPAVHYLLAALGDANAPTAAPADYVRQLFDGYAADFDHHLVQGLQYQAHERLVRQVLTGGRRFAAALDLGCGTGLCGALLRPQTGRLEGVDLSPAMLEQARQRGCYDDLHLAELVQHLAHTTLQPDLVLAADVFIYVGDLAPVFAGVQRVLQPGGLLAFSVERHVGTEPWVLRESARYAHERGALRALAAAHGLQPAWEEAAPLRLDQRQPVQGLYLGFSRPA